MKTWPKDFHAEDLLKEAEELIDPKPAAMPKLEGCRGDANFVDKSHGRLDSEARADATPRNDYNLNLEDYRNESR